jgi:hypothetical protein
MATVVLAAAAASAAAVLVLRFSAREPVAMPTPAASAIAARPTPAVSPEETCILGRPNSSDLVVVVLTGRGAAAVCNDITNPVRNTNELKGRAILASNTWAPYRACQFDRYGLTWTIWDAINAAVTSGPFGPRRPGGTLCPS